MHPVIEIADIHKTYPSSLEEALRGVTFDVMPGELFGILGINGAGKSTFLNIFIGLVTPTSGTIRVFGKDLFREPELRQRMNIGTAYADLSANITVEENLMVYAKMYNQRHPQEMIAGLLDELGIADLARHRFDNLSAGQRTKVNLCKSLINDPEILLLDEPTASLDPASADIVRRLIKKRRSEYGMTVLLTSHNMREVEELCDRVALLQNGQVYKIATPHALIEYLKVSDMEEVFLTLTRAEYEMA